MLEIKNLTYERDDTLIIKNLSLVLKPGNFLYIAGDNGKGKTTLLKLIAGILRPTSGKIAWRTIKFKGVNNVYDLYNEPVDDNSNTTGNFYHKINYIGHKSAVALPLTPLENLFFASRAYKLKSTIGEALFAVDIAHKYNVPASQLSAGQIRRIALAKLVLLDTPLWLLDEPYTALDKKSILWLKGHIHRHLDNGGMVIMTSHQSHDILRKNSWEIHL